MSFLRRSSPKSILEQTTKTALLDAPPGTRGASLAWLQSDAPHRHKKSRTGVAPPMRSSELVGQLQSGWQPQAMEERKAPVVSYYLPRR